MLTTALKGAMALRDESGACARVLLAESLAAVGGRMEAAAASKVCDTTVRDLLRAGRPDPEMFRIAAVSIRP